MINEWIIKIYFNLTGLIYCDRNPSNPWESASSSLVCCVLTHRLHYSALGREIGGIQRPFYFFLQRIQLPTSFDTPFYLAQHLPNDSNLPAQVRILCQEDTAVASSRIFNKCLSFSAYLLILRSPLFCMSSTTWKVCQIYGILIIFFQLLLILVKKYPDVCLSLL